MAVQLRGQGADPLQQDRSVDPGEARRGLAGIQSPEHVAQFQGLRHPPAHEPGRAFHGLRLGIEHRFRRRDAQPPQLARGIEAQARPSAPPATAKSGPDIVMAELLDDHGDVAPVPARPPRGLVQVAPAPVQAAACVGRIEDAAKGRLEVDVQVATGGLRVHSAGQAVELEPVLRPVHLEDQILSPATTNCSRCNSGSACTRTGASNAPCKPSSTADSAPRRPSRTSGCTRTAN